MYKTLSPGAIGIRGLSLERVHSSWRSATGFRRSGFQHTRGGGAGRGEGARRIV